MWQDCVKYNFFMKNIKFNLKIFIFIIIFICFLFFFCKYKTSDVDYIKDNFDIKKQKESTYKVIKKDVQQLSSITLTAGETVVNLTIIPGQNLYEILQNKQNKELIYFDGKDYPGLGFFVTKIGTLESINGKYLFYYVNGVEALKGISSYIPQAGDMVEWKIR